MAVAVVATHAVADGLAQLLVIVAGSVYITDFRFLEEEEGTENIWIRLCHLLILALVLTIAHESSSSRSQL